MNVVVYEAFELARVGLFERQEPTQIAVNDDFVALSEPRVYWMVYLDPLISNTTIYTLYSM